MRDCIKNLAAFPAGLRFKPSDQELIEHLESMVLEKEGGGSRAHALINHFIPTIEEDIGICYTHPENLPGEIERTLILEDASQVSRYIDTYMMDPDYFSFAMYSGEICE